MSRKQALKLKKERARNQALEGRLERLHQQGADEAFLDLIQGRTRDLTPASAQLYGQVVDRALRRALAGADLPRVQRLLSRIDREARARPLVAFSEAVVHIAEGRLDEARNRLAALAPETAGDAPWPPGLTAALAALCSPAAPVTSAIQRFYQALAVLPEQEFHPGSTAVEELRQAAGALRTVLPADADLQRFLGTTEEFLRLLTELPELEQALRSRDGAGLVPFFLERIKGLSRSLLAAFRDPPPALLRPLHHALRLRWRTLLALVAERQGAAAWIELHAALPALFAVDLELGSGPERRNRTAVRELQETRDYRQLARLLDSLSSAEKVPARLALLWSVELWAWQRAARTEGEEDEPPAFAEPADHAALRRLGRMAGDIAGRLPAAQRPEAARFLRARLFDLCESQFFCVHAMEAAAALLRHLPDDPGLLVVALSGAVCAQDVRAQRLFAARIAERGEAPATDREAVLRLVAQIALEKTEILLRVLPSLRSLLGEEAWPQALEVVLQGVIDFVCAGLDWSDDEADVRHLLQEVALYRATLAGRPEFGALEAALACARQEGSGAQALRSVLKRSPELEVALVALRVLTTALSPWAPPAVGKALRHVRGAVISRLDLRWRLWTPLLSRLVLGADRRQIQTLHDRLDRLLQSAGLQEEDRQALEGAREAIANLQRLENAFGRRPAQGNSRPGKPRRRRAAEGQLDFDLF